LVKFFHLVLFLHWKEFQFLLQTSEYPRKMDGSTNTPVPKSSISKRHKNFIITEKRWDLFNVLGAGCIRELLKYLTIQDTRNLGNSQRSTIGVSMRMHAVAIDRLNTELVVCSAFHQAFHWVHYHYHNPERNRSDLVSITQFLWLCSLGWYDILNTLTRPQDECFAVERKFILSWTAAKVISIMESKHLLFQADPTPWNAALQPGRTDMLIIKRGAAFIGRSAITLLNLVKLHRTGVKGYNSPNSSMEFWIAYLKRKEETLESYETFPMQVA